MISNKILIPFLFHEMLQNEILLVFCFNQSGKIPMKCLAISSCFVFCELSLFMKNGNPIYIWAASRAPPPHLECTYVFNTTVKYLKYKFKKPKS